MVDLKFDHVSKRYRIRHEQGQSVDPVRAKDTRAFRRGWEDFWAVRDISFEVQRGEALGIIGPNGAGKSTILKLLSNITAPTAGEIRINGRLSALIEVGSGFHPELTGRENVYLSGSILGMRRREISRKLASIVDFAEVGQFLDTPVKHYSSGMYVRLGFSIAAHLEPDILLLDEVLAVGDASFQAKCLRRIRELEQEGKTIVFISHDLSAVENLCDRVILITHGELKMVGPAREVVTEYRCGMSNLVPSVVLDESPTGQPNAEVLALDLYNAAESETASARTGGHLTARVKYRARVPIKDVAFEVYFYSEAGGLRTQFTTATAGKSVDLESGVGVVNFSCAELGLQPGEYKTYAAVKDRQASPENLIHWLAGSVLNVRAGKSTRGIFFMPHEWTISHESQVGLEGSSFAVYDR